MTDWGGRQPRRLVTWHPRRITDWRIVAWRQHGDRRKVKRRLNRQERHAAKLEIRQEAT